MYDSQTIKLTAAGKRFWNTKKQTMRLVVVDSAIELSNGYWQEGSRDEYRGQTKSGSIVQMQYPTTPREYGGGVAPSVMPTADMAIVRFGISSGKVMAPTAYVTSIDGWIV